MDPVESFIRSGKKFSLHALINAHSRLSVLQLSKGGFVFDDVMQSLSMSGHELSVAELNAHAALVYESVVISHAGQKNLQMNREVLANDANFIRHIVNAIYQRCGGMEFPAVEEFNMEAFMFLKGNYHKSSSSDNDGNNPLTRNNYGNQTSANFTQNYQSFQLQPSKQRFSTANDGAIKKFPQPEQILDGDYRSPLSRIEFEKSEPIVRLLAQVRKVGMDILFPQSTHDKILACIFVAIRSATTPAHRELIDMVMAVKDSNHVSQLDSVSKTKVRGVLALLKHGELLVTQGSEGEPVRLYLAYGINSFKELRERHDAFLNRYMIEHHLFIPAILKSELVWQVDDDMRIQRIEAMNKLVSQLQLFFQGYQSKAAEYDDSSVGVGFNNGTSNNLSGKSFVSLVSDDSKVTFPANNMGSALGMSSDSFLLTSKSSRAVPQEDAVNVGRFDPLSSSLPAAASVEQPSNDVDSPDWINIGRKAAVQTKKASQSNQPPPNTQYFGSSFQNSNFSATSRNYVGHQHNHVSHSFNQSRGNSNMMQQQQQQQILMGQSGYRSSSFGDHRFSNAQNQFQQSGGNNQSNKHSSLPSLHQNIMAVNSSDNFGLPLTAASSFVGRSGMVATAAAGSSGGSNSGGATRGSNSGVSTGSGYQYGSVGNAVSPLNVTSSNDRWSQQSYYRDDFLSSQASKSSSSFVGDFNRNGTKGALPLGFGAHDDEVVFDTDKLMQSLPSDSSFMNNASIANFEYGGFGAPSRNGSNNPKISFPFSDVSIQNDDYPSAIRETNDSLVVSEHSTDDASLANIVSDEVIDVSTGALPESDVHMRGNDSLN